MDLNKIIKALSTLIGILSEDVKLYMELLTADRYHALNDRTIHLLSQGEVDMSATSAEFGFAPMAAANNVSNADVQELLESGTEVDIFVVDKNKTRAGGTFFTFLNLALLNLGKYGLFKTIGRYSYKHNCL